MMIKAEWPWLKTPIQDFGKLRAFSFGWLPIAEAALRAYEHSLNTPTAEFYEEVTKGPESKTGDNLIIAYCHAFADEPGIILKGKRSPSRKYEPVIINPRAIHFQPNGDICGHLGEKLWTDVRIRRIDYYRFLRSDNRWAIGAKYWGN